MIPDLYEPGHTLRVTLDPSLPVSPCRWRRSAFVGCGQAGERDLAHLMRRYELVSREATRSGSRTLSLLAGVQSFGRRAQALRSDSGKISASTRARRGGSVDSHARKASDGRRRNRSFDLDANWFAMVGRSNIEKRRAHFPRVASPDRLVVLRRREFPGSHGAAPAPRRKTATEHRPPAVLEQAASIADALLQGPRHQRLVPVIYTRQALTCGKFRGAEPGQVKCVARDHGDGPARASDDG
jgi:hypothetical protein